jgi:hypothetical protein
LVEDPLVPVLLGQASRICNNLGLVGLATTLLTTSSSSTFTTTTVASTTSGGGGGGGTTSDTATTAVGGGPFPTVEQVQAAAHKAYAEQPPWVHWSKVDQAANNAFKTTGNYRLGIVGAFRGYRMARASQGVSSGAYYYECWVQPGPTPTEIVQNLPTHVRLGPNLQRALEAALTAQQRQEQRRSSSNSNRNVTNHEEDEEEEDEIPQVGGHLRLGWSMRTGDLQAPVGYDKWSYGIRDLGGITHQSIVNAEGVWGTTFGPGDVVGAAICLDPEDPSRNHIRFFRNVECLGEFLLIKGKRSGGEAFTNIVSGTYYPAVSSYMAGACTANFGPKFVYPPRKLPPGLKLAPYSDLCPAPPSYETVLAELQPVLRQFKKEEHKTALQQAVAAETTVLHEIHETYLAQHLQDIRAQRVDRGLSVADFPEAVVDEKQTNNN